MCIHQRARHYALSDFLVETHFDHCVWVFKNELLMFQIIQGVPPGQQPPPAILTAPPPFSTPPPVGMPGAPPGMVPGVNISEPPPVQQPAPTMIPISAAAPPGPAAQTYYQQYVHTVSSNVIMRVKVSKIHVLLQCQLHAVDKTTTT